VSHIPWDNVELDRLLELFTVWVAMVVFQLEVACAVCGGLADWAMVVTMVGSWVDAIRLYNRKSFKAHPISVLLAWRTQLLAGSHCHVACRLIVSGVKAMDTCWAWPWPNVSLRIHFTNGKRCWTELWPCRATTLGSIATEILLPAQLQSITWKNEHSSWSGWANCIKTLCNIHCVILRLMVRGYSWSMSWTSLFVTSVISLQNVACFCNSWSSPSRFFCSAHLLVGPLISIVQMETLLPILSYVFLHIFV